MQYLYKVKITQFYREYEGMIVLDKENLAE